MNVEFLWAAERDLAEAISYYNEQREGLGYGFAAEIRRTLNRIVDFPDAWHPLSPRTRRCRAKRFPYAVVYQIRDDIILVVAIMHLRQHPDSWRRRIEPAMQ